MRDEVSRGTSIENHWQDRCSNKSRFAEGDQPEGGLHYTFVLARVVPGRVISNLTESIL